jgi:hypothetical protein
MYNLKTKKEAEVIYLLFGIICEVVNLTELAEGHVQRLTSVSALFKNRVEPEASLLFVQ